MMFNRHPSRRQSDGVTLALPANPGTPIQRLPCLIAIAVSVAIVIRRSCCSRLLAEVAVSLFCMAGAAVFTPETWVELLGALVKIRPAIVPTGGAPAIMEER